MHSGDLAELGGVNLTDIERAALLEVMQRAKVSHLEYYNNDPWIICFLRTLMTRLTNLRTGEQ